MDYKRLITFVLAAYVVLMMVTSPMAAVSAPPQETGEDVYTITSLNPDVNTLTPTEVSSFEQQVETGNNTTTSEPPS